MIISGAHHKPHKHIPQKQTHCATITTNQKNMSKVAAILGVGPGLGFSLAKKFSSQGYTVVVMARNTDKLTSIVSDIEHRGGKAVAIGVDSTSESAMERAFETMRSTVGPPSLFVYNVGSVFGVKSMLELSLSEFKQNFDLNCTGCFLAAKNVLPDMLKNKANSDTKNTFIVTGATASVRGGSQFSGLSVGKFGLRSLAQSMAREFGPQGIHVAHVIVDGKIDTGSDYVKHIEKSKLLNPDAMADVYWHLHTQDPTVWTHELDLRPSEEKW